jgi:hypothetical protein
MIWRISSIKTGETALTLSLLVGDFVCLRAIIHSLTVSSRFHLGVASIAMGCCFSRACFINICAE